MPHQNPSLSERIPCNRGAMNLHLSITTGIPDHIETLLRLDFPRLAQRPLVLLLCWRKRGLPAIASRRLLIGQRFVLILVLQVRQGGANPRITERRGEVEEI